MTLADLGYQPELEQYRRREQLDSFTIGRVIAEHRERYLVHTGEREFEAEVIGHLRFTAQSRADFPAVGDWVAISAYDEDKALIHHILPRRGSIERKAVGKPGDKQIIATNIDYAIIVQAVDRDFNLNRLERYLTICHAAGVAPIIVLNKIDLIDEATLADLTAQVKARTRDVPVITLSNETQEGIEQLQALIRKGTTYCLLGSSGVGKSSLLNNLVGAEHMKTSAISDSVHKGRHTTSHRELIVLPAGGVVIDNPGMREVGLADAEAGLAVTFGPLLEWAETCKFKDCTHTDELGCAVLAALDKGELDEVLYQNYQKMKREEAHFESTVAERRKKDKAFGKMVKEVKKRKDWEKS